MKPATLLLIAVVLVAATAASAVDIRTRVQGGKCRQQIREQEEKLQHCRQYMRSAMQGGEEEEEDELTSTCSVGCEMGNEDCCARECCRALERMDDECACQTVKALAQQATTETRSARMGTRTAARMLANRCGISQQCGVRAVFV